ncbi:MAG TPA: hypothetical protein VL282_16895 [Tepidisphaeraceae bacterium]|jgi:hypothetical protein|nr:hypothetical protein [Tepidisphaeraceae bacterium]
MRRLVGNVCAVIYILFFAQHSQASFSAIGQQATVDDATRTVHFDVLFNQQPDFVTTNAQGDDASAFQVFVDPKPSPTGFDYFDTVSLVRGVNLDSKDELPVVNVKDGAFGDVRGITHFQLDDSMVHFSVPFDLIGTSDGRFDYRVESYQFGTLTSLIDSTTTAVPLPPAAYGVIPTAMMMGGIMLARRRKSA